MQLHSFVNNEGKSSLTAWYYEGWKGEIPHFDMFINTDQLTWYTKIGFILSYRQMYASVFDLLQLYIWVEGIFNCAQKIVIKLDINNSSHNGFIVKFLWASHASDFIVTEWILINFVQPWDELISLTNTFVGRSSLIWFIIASRTFS